MATEVTPSPRSDVTTSAPLISKQWVQGVALVMIFGFLVMGILVSRTYTASMPMPDVSESGKTPPAGGDYPRQCAGAGERRGDVPGGSPLKAILAVEKYAVATSQIAQTTLRSLLGRADLDTLLAHREDLNTDLRAVIEKQTESWGVEMRVVEIRDVEIPESMQRAMAREAEAEREGRAKVINAHGELQASEELRQAAETLSKTPASLQLRYLQTLFELGADHNSTVVFPLPVDIITPFLKHPEVLSDIARSLNDRG
jgi:hypothetical protein